MDMIYDSHAHYDSRQFQEDRDVLLQSLPEQGICGVINCGSDLKTSRFSIKLAQKYPYIYAAAGIHPHEAEHAGDFIGPLSEMLSHKRVKALGEIGLDYHYNFSPRDIQKQVFEAQLELAVSMGLPVIVHDREAHADTLELLQKYRPKGVVHCFSGSREMAEEILKIGMCIGLGGAVTFKNARRPLEVAAIVPENRLLIETDAPYMAPVPHRGKRCDSTYIPYTAGVLAKVRGVTSSQILAATCANAAELFAAPAVYPKT